MNKLNSFLFLLIYSLLCLYAVTFNNKLGWILLTFFTLFFLISLISMISPISKIYVKDLDERVLEIGEKSHLKIEIESKGKIKIFYPVLVIENAVLSFQKILPLFFKKREDFVIELIPNRRGAYKTLEMKIRSSDLFGLLYKEKNQSIKANLFVLPHFLPEVINLLPLIKLKEEIWRFGEPTFDLEKLRTYQKGDSVKQIDWKISSKKQTLIVKEYEQVKSVRPLLIFYGVRSFYYEQTLAVFYSLYQIIDDVDFLLIESETRYWLNPSIYQFCEIERSNDPGKFPELEAENLIIFTPERTKRFEKQLEQLDKHKNIQVVDFTSLKEEVFLNDV